MNLPIEQSLTARALAAHHARHAQQEAARLSEEERRALLRAHRGEEAANIVAGFVEKLFGIPVIAANIAVDFNPDDLPLQARFHKERRYFLCMIADTSRPMKLMLQHKGFYHEINELADLGALIERFPLEPSSEELPDCDDVEASGAQGVEP